MPDLGLSDLNSILTILGTFNAKNQSSCQGGILQDLNPWHC